MAPSDPAAAGSPGSGSQPRGQANRRPFDDLRVGRLTRR